MTMVDTIIMIAMCAVGLIVSFLFLSMVMDGNVRKVVKVFYAICFFALITANILMYIIAIDPEMLMNISYPISMSVGVFIGLMLFVLFGMPKGKSIRYLAENR